MSKGQFIILAGTVVLIWVLILGLDSTGFFPGLLYQSQRQTEENVGEDITLIFVGDVMLGRRIETLWREGGADYPFSATAELTRQADLAVANLEGPIVGEHQQTPDGSLVFSFASSTTRTLAWAGFDFVSLGNNHTLDQGQRGLAETRNYLEAADIGFAGNPLKIDEDSAKTILAAYKKISLVSFNATWPQFNQDEALTLIASQASAEPDLLVVSIHWGDEYSPVPNQTQKDLAYKMIEAGTDLIIGHHPHVVQNVEVYQGRPIFYSLGNFIFDQYFSDEVQEGLMVRLELKDGEARYQLLPTRSELSQPRLMNEPERTIFLAGLSQRSGLADVEDGLLILPK